MHQMNVRVDQMGEPKHARECRQVTYNPRELDLAHRVAPSVRVAKLTAAAG